MAWRRWFAASAITEANSAERRATTLVPQQPGSRRNTLMERIPVGIGCNLSPPSIPSGALERLAIVEFGARPSIQRRYAVVQVREHCVEAVAGEVICNVLGVRYVEAPYVMKDKDAYLPRDRVTGRGQISGCTAACTVDALQILCIAHDANAAGLLHRHKALQ